MRILFIANHQLRKNAQFGGYSGSTQKLINGFIRAGHNVYIFSDRDFIYFKSPLGIRDFGKKHLNKALIETASFFEPELIVISHCELISKRTLISIKKKFPSVPLVHWNLDGIFTPANIERLLGLSTITEKIFITTSSHELNNHLSLSSNIRYVPNIVDPSIDIFDSSRENHHCNDLMFCGRHAPHIARQNILNKIRKELPADIRFNVYGNFNNKNNFLWGNRYLKILSKTKMGLCLNYHEGFKLYSSDRLAQLVGNGVLAFISSRSCYDKLLPTDTLVYYSTIDELIDKIKYFYRNDKQRRSWASNAKKYFFKHFQSDIIARYIIEESCGLSHSQNYIWHGM